MQNILALIFLLLFGVSTVLTYLAVRRRGCGFCSRPCWHPGRYRDDHVASMARGIWFPQAVLTGSCSASCSPQ